MMNETVRRIVDMMFENVEMTEEVASLRDEVMNNCQERYADLVGSGMSEEDAISAVVESLRGMEDVVSQYQRTARRSEKPEVVFSACDMAGEPGGEQDLTFAASAVQRINVALVSEDVRIEASCDDDYHVCWNADEDPQITVRAEGGVLHVERMAGELGRAGSAARKACVDAKDGLKNARVYVDGEEMGLDEIGQAVGKAMDGVGSMLEGLGRSLGRMFSGLRNSITGGDGVVLRVPADAAPSVKVLTTSGDVDVIQACMMSLAITSTSGDVKVVLREAEHIDRVEIRTVSGDVEADVHADSLLTNTTSGDVDVYGVARELTANTVSGDVDVSAEIEKIRFKTISGDVDVELACVELREITGSTVSGDIDVDLPVGVGQIAIQTQTRSGDITTCYHTEDSGFTVTGSLNTMSGDITIR